VVGPNGCGKVEQIIDAVRCDGRDLGVSTCAATRWPTSSSTARARASRSARRSVELVFDNSDRQMLGGEYASYAEVR